MELTVSIPWEITTVAAHQDLLEMGNRMVMVALVRKMQFNCHKIQILDITLQILMNAWLIVTSETAAS